MKSVEKHLLKTREWSIVVAKSTPDYKIPEQRLNGLLMKKTLLHSFFLPALVAGSLLTGQSFAQENSPQNVKRNSPFSPNPKKKVETPQTANPPNTEKPVKNADATNKDIGEAPVQIANKIPENGGDPQFQNAGFESRSAASKTLEVVKKAAPVSPTEIYKVGVGDVLFISLQNAPAKESTYFTVLKDGTIDYPLAGEMVTVAGLTTGEIETLLASKIKLYENPQVAVKVREHNSHSYTVLGLVEKPGEKFLQREAIPLYVVRAEAITQSKAGRAVIKRSDSQTETVNLKDKKYEDVLIFPGDIVEFAAEDAAVAATENQPQFYYIGGAIKDGGQKNFYKGITLTQAIIASGGLKKASVQNVTIRRKNEAGFLVPTNYNLKAIKDGQAADPVLEAGDTIEVGN